MRELRYKDILNYFLIQDYRYDLNIDTNRSLLLPFLKLNLSLLTKFIMIFANVIILILTIIPWSIGWLVCFVNQKIEQRKLGLKDIEDEEENNPLKNVII